jgi:hypothetical protein
MEKKARNALNGGTKCAFNDIFIAFTALICIAIKTENVLKIFICFRFEENEYENVPPFEISASFSRFAGERDCRFIHRQICIHHR